MAREFRWEFDRVIDLRVVGQGTDLLVGREEEVGECGGVWEFVVEEFRLSDFEGECLEGKRRW
jgi:hypothetical protein